MISQKKNPISQYSSNIQHDVRRHHILMRRYQPELHEFPKSKFVNKDRQFYPQWFNPPYSAWLEYSIKMMLHFVCVVICPRMNLKVMTMRGNHLYKMVLEVGTMFRN